MNRDPLTASEQCEGACSQQRVDFRIEDTATQPQRSGTTSTLESAIQPSGKESSLLHDKLGLHELRGKYQCNGFRKLGSDTHS